jgi:dTDP-4-dehydrorhamnose reductase
MLGTDLFSILSSGHDVTGKDVDDFDITSSRDCRLVVRDAAPQIVINAAANTDVDGCETEADSCFKINAEGVNHIALACQDQDIKIVHFSTDYIFDGTKRSPYVEGDAPNPINTYGQSKLQGELYLRALSRNYLIIRTAWLYGKNGRNFVKAIMDRAKSEKKLTVVNDQVGSPTYTVDLAGAVRTLIEGGHAGIFNVTNRGKCSWYEFARKILECAGLKDVEIEPIATEALARKALRPSYSVLSCLKFASECRKTMRFWQIALSEYLQ